MTAILILFLLGVALLALDVFAASFILALGGAAVMFGGAAVAYRNFGAGAAGAAGLAALVLLALTIYLEIVILPKTRFGRGLIVHSASGAPQAPLATLSAVVGRDAAALTTLAPSGYVLVDGQRYEAFCQSGHADKGALLRVVGLDNFRVIVSKP
jgi:membrane-bound ClpP family serine protease